MPTTSVGRVIDAPIEKVWRVVADFGKTSRYNPAVPVSYSIGDQESGLGARRRCEFDDAGEKFIEERIVEFDETSHRYTVELVGGTAKPPIDEVRVGISVVDLGDATTEITMTSDLVGRSLGRRIMAAVAVPMMKRVTRQVVAGLDHYIASGEEVADLAQIKAAGLKV